MKKRSSWSWYGVKIIKQIVVSGEPDVNLIKAAEKRGLDYVEDSKQEFEELIILVKAQSFDHAYKTAEKITNNDNEKYLNIYGQEVEWKFIDAVDCFNLFDNILRTGTEFYSCIHSTDKETSPEEFIAKWFCTEDSCRRKGRHL